jgi:hypothetical protein
VFYLLPPIPFSTGCKLTITDDDDETEDPETYEKEYKLERKNLFMRKIQFLVIIK